LYPNQSVAFAASALKITETAKLILPHSEFCAGTFTALGPLSIKAGENEDIISTSNTANNGLLIGGATNGVVLGNGEDTEQDAWFSSKKTGIGAKVIFATDAASSILQQGIVRVQGENDSVGGAEFRAGDPESGALSTITPRGTGKIELVSGITSQSNGRLFLTWANVVGGVAAGKIMGTATSATIDGTALASTTLNRAFGDLQIIVTGGNRAGDLLLMSAKTDGLGSEISSISDLDA